MFHTRAGKEKPLDLIHHSAVILSSKSCYEATLQV